VKEVVTIDGPAGAGKSTVARRLAQRLGYLYLDTGAMYRAVALAARRAGIPPEDAEALAAMCRGLDLRMELRRDPPRVLLYGKDVTARLRTPEMDLLASKVSAVGPVREAMVALQRGLALKHPLVAEGRDMGTVVFPEAPHKFFLTASLEKRVERRLRERQQRGERVTRDEVRAEMRRRDEQDATRSLAPLRPAPDARIIDTTSLNVEEVVERLLSELG